MTRKDRNGKLLKIGSRVTYAWGGVEFTILGLFNAGDGLIVADDVYRIPFLVSAHDMILKEEQTP